MAHPEPGPQDAPYLDALREYAARNPARLHIPGHKGGPGADPELREAFGVAAFAHDIPALTWGIDIGPKPTPFEQAQQRAAQAWGARRTWFLMNGASQGNLATGLALAHAGDEVVLQRNGHSSTIGALARTPAAVAAWIVSPTYFGACADVCALARVAHGRGVPLVVDEAWGAHL